jgi:RNA polymerase sigma factor (sigma-70 family)
MAFLRSIGHWGSEPVRSDDMLLEAYQQHKDLQALSDLFERYMDLVFGLCMKYLKESDDAKDAVMGIFEVLVRDLAKPVQVRHFKSWLYTVAKHYCLMQLRSAGKGKIVEISPDHMQSGEVLHLYRGEDEERLLKLEQCMEALPSEQRRVILLFYRDNKCYNDIEALTGLDWNKVRSHIQNGRRNLKICIENKVHAPKRI